MVEDKIKVGTGASDVKHQLDNILQENFNLASKIDYSQIPALITSINNANRIFIIAAGRSGFSMRSIAMRLMHLGLKVFFVGETTTPAIAKGDLLIAASGSGTTSTIVKAAEKSVGAGATVIALSTNTSSPLAALAKHIIIIPAAEKQDHGDELSKQYAGSLFEQFLLLLLDAVFQSLWKIDGTPAEELWKRHANME
ncbi:MAG: 6-phospho-3-hexuloisomerase [Ferruginibacter sp.]|nr:6-phospho-3-hexuloisomerase [Ferruginibacter sp.]